MKPLLNASDQLAAEPVQEPPINIATRQAVSFIDRLRAAVDDLPRVTEEVEQAGKALGVVQQLRSQFSVHISHVHRQSNNKNRNA